MNSEVVKIIFKRFVPLTVYTGNTIKTIRASLFFISYTLRGVCIQRLKKSKATSRLFNYCKVTLFFFFFIIISFFFLQL